MALLGKSIAIASVGISCQPASQMNRHAEVISALAGEQVIERSTPFDWLLCDMRSVTAMIRSRTFFPESLAELEERNKPYWPRFNCNFWHAKIGVKAGDWPAFRDKHAHKANNWRAIGDRRRLIFIASNCQNNVARALLAQGRPPIETRMLWRDIVGMYESLLWYFGGSIELHVCTQRGIHDAPQASPLLVPIGGPPRVALHALGIDRSQWEGDVRGWSAFFHKIIPAKS